jgi:hypothetical protein
MATSSFYMKDGIQVPEKRVSKLTAVFIFLIFAVCVVYLYERYIPQIEARNAAAAAEAEVPAPAKAPAKIVVKKVE